MFGFGKKNEPSPSKAVATPPATPPAPQAPAAPEARQQQVDPATQQLRSEARRMNLVGNAQLGSAIAEAVREGLSEQFVFEEEQLRAAVETIGRGLFLRLKSQAISVRGLPKQAFLRAVEEDKRKIEAESERARKELEQLLSELQERSSEVGRMQANLVRESRESAIVEDRAIADYIAKLFEGCQTPEDYERVREQVTSLTLGSLQEERDKSIEAQLAESRKEVEQYKRRISKLTNSLELTEEELKRIAAAKNIDLGVQSIYRTVQGLSSGDDEERRDEQHRI